MATDLNTNVFQYNQHRYRARAELRQKLAELNLTDGMVAGILSVSLEQAQRKLKGTEEFTGDELEVLRELTGWTLDRMMLGKLETQEKRRYSSIHYPDMIRELSDILKRCSHHGNRAILEDQLEKFTTKYPAEDLNVLAQNLAEDLDQKTDG